MVAVAVVASLVVGSVAWGATTAIEAAAADEQREAARLDVLGDLLVERSEASELLADSARVIATATEGGGDTVALTAVHDELAAEIARPLDRESSHRSVIVQSRLLASDLRRLMVSLDDQVRSVIAEARAARSASPLATAETLATLEQAIADLSVVRQGLPSSYTGRATLIAALVTGRTAVTESHAFEKAEQERLEAERLAAERRAAEEAARRSSGGSGGGSSGIVYPWTDDMIAAGCWIVSQTSMSIVWDCPPGYYGPHINF